MHHHHHQRAFALVAVVAAAAVAAADAFTQCASLKNNQNEMVQLWYEWSAINFTWPSAALYQEALSTRRYVPEDNIIVGVKYYDEKLYVALPKAKAGSPVSVASLPLVSDNDTRRDVLLKPFPSWEMNDARLGCGALQDVQSLEIDRYGIMWVLDGRRLDQAFRTECPPKIVLFDINRGGKLVKTHVVPNKVCNHSTCFLNDLVIDDINGGYAYITDTDANDPGVIVYSRQQNRSWKIRHGSMRAEDGASNFTYGGQVQTRQVPVDGIALGPQMTLDDLNRPIFFTALTGLGLYAINSSVARNEQLATSKHVGKYINKLGDKKGPSDGMVMDSDRQLFYGVLTDNAIAKWDFSDGKSHQDIVQTDSELLAWPDSFGFDNFGSLYVVANNIGYFLDNNVTVAQVNVRILKLYTGTCSYQF